MTVFVRIQDGLGFHRSVPVGRVPEGATVLDGVKAADSHGQALPPTLPSREADKADDETRGTTVPDDKPKTGRKEAQK